MHPARGDALQPHRHCCVSSARPPMNLLYSPNARGPLRVDMMEPEIDRPSGECRPESSHSISSTQTCGSSSHLMGKYHLGLSIGGCDGHHERVDFSHEMDGTIRI
jgi:hypothetical protein